MQLQVTIIGDRALHFGAGHVDGGGIPLAQNFGNKLLYTDIKRQADILAGTRLKIAENTNGTAAGIHFNAFISRSATKRRLARILDTDFTCRKIGQIGQRTVVFDLAFGNGRDIAGDMRRERTLRINPSQRFFKPYTRQIGRPYSQSRQFSLGQAFTDQNGPEGRLLVRLLQYLGNNIIIQVYNGAKLSQRRLQIARI